MIWPRGALLLVFLLPLLAACSKYLAPHNETDATVYVLNTIPGRGQHAHTLSLDGEEIASLGPRQYTWFRLPPGSYTFAVSGSAKKGREQSAVRLTLLAGATRFLVYDEDQRFDYLIEYGEEHALGWIQGARYVSNLIER